MEKLPKIFQEFHLDEEAMNETRKKHPEKKLIELLPPTPGAELIKKLDAKGYTILWSLTVLNGIPISFVVGTELASKTNVKEDFLQVAESLGIEWFRTGVGYGMLEE